MSNPITRLDHYRLLGRSGLRISPLCLGTMTFGTAWGWGANKKTCRVIWDRYAAAGGNFIDTANFYTDGESERFVGECMKGDRERFVIGTKYTLKTTNGDPNAAGNSRKNMMQAIEASLKRLGTDYIDLYWLHAWDFTTPVDEVMRAFDDLVRAGKVLYIAISDTPAWKIAQLNTYAELHALSYFVATQVQYHVAMRDVERDIMPMCREMGLACLPWSPLASGILTGKYRRDDMQKERQLIECGEAKPFGMDNRIVGLNEHKLKVADEVQEVAKAIGRSPAQVALNWLATKDGVTSIILGARTLEQLEDNLGCLDFTLDDEHVEQLERVSAITLGFPHDFLHGEFVRDLVTAGTTVEQPAAR